MTVPSLYEPAGPGVARWQVSFFCFAAALMVNMPSIFHVTKDKATLLIPETRSLNLRAGVVEFGPLLWELIESKPQTPSPLIRPADLDFGRTGRGEIKTGAIMIEPLLFALLHCKADPRYPFDCVPF